MSRTIEKGIHTKRFKPGKPKTRYFRIRFNGEWLHGSVRVYDARTPYEKETCVKKKRLPGPVLVFYHGHAQRPMQAYHLAACMALESKSGMVVVPVCDTPYGRDRSFRGDDGKTVVLMELVNFVLAESGISIEACPSPVEHPVLIQEKWISAKKKRAFIEKLNDRLRELIGSHLAGSVPRKIYPLLGVISGDYDRFAKTKGAKKTGPVTAKVLPVGWSHGAILARRCASAFRKSAEGLIQFCPAGYRKWGNEAFWGPFKLWLVFLCECINISTGIFSRPFEVNDATHGILRGTIGDSLRAWPAFLTGNKHPFKLFRNLRDVKDCARYVDESRFPVGKLDRVIVIFGRKDFLFKFRDVMKIPDPPVIPEEETARFFRTFYGNVRGNRSRRKVFILTGNHIGPTAHHLEYVETALEAAGERRKPGV